MLDFLIGFGIAVILVAVAATAVSLFRRDA